jgi:hypothetical protein
MLLSLTAATMSALRRTRRRAQVLHRIGVKLLFAPGAAEVMGLTFDLALSSGGSGFYFHAADRIFHSGCGMRYDLPR